MHTKLLQNYIFAAGFYYRVNYIIVYIMNQIRSNQFDELLTLDEKFLVMFYADWCPFCQNFKPIFDSTVLDLGNNKKVYECKINDDDDPLWDRFSINAVPTLIAFEKGQIISRKDSKLGIGLKQTDIDSILSVI